MSRLQVRRARSPFSGICLIAGLLAIGAARPVAAQSGMVGYLPEHSPYRDVDSPSELSLFTGFLTTQRDLAGAEFQNAPVLGIRELVHLGGPAIFYARVMHAFSDRDVINPGAPESSRIVGTRGGGLTLGDLDLGINFTGDRSWHNLMPYFGAGPGVVSDLGAPRDLGDYHFGTAFAVTYGGGFRWVPAGRFSAHLDANSYLWSYHYPTTYHTTAVDGTQVIATTHHLSGWRNNGLFTLGFSYQILH